MTVTTVTTAGTSRPTGGENRRARAAGVLYLLTFLTSVPTLALYRPLREGGRFVLGAGSGSGVLVGLTLEMALALCCAATAVVLLPVARRQSETAALGFLAARTVEATLILVGVASLWAVVGLRDGASDAADPASLETAGRALVEVYDGTFLLGQSLMPVVSAVCLGTVMYRSGLVPRVIPLVGLVGAPLLLASDIAVLTGLYDQRAGVAGLAALPIAIWELALGVWLTTRGFRPSPVLTGR